MLVEVPTGPLNPKQSWRAEGSWVLCAVHKLDPSADDKGSRKHAQPLRLLRCEEQRGRTSRPPYTKPQHQRVQSHLANRQRPPVARAGSAMTRQAVSMASPEWRSEDRRLRRHPAFSRARAELGPAQHGSGTVAPDRSCSVSGPSPSRIATARAMSHRTRGKKV